MARKGKPKEFKFKGFVNLEFTEDERSEIVKWMTAFGESPATACVVPVEAGYKISVGYDDYHNCYQVSMTCKDPGSTYCGYCLTLKHSDIGRGLLILCWLYAEQLKDEIFPLDAPLRSFDW